MTTEIPVAPPDWFYHQFPLAAPHERILDLEQVTEIALSMIARAGASGDEAHFGDTLHWAHLLKAEQGAAGDWPAVVDARTGEARSKRRTRRPAALLARLGEVLDTSEFDDAVALAGS